MFCCIIEQYNALFGIMDILSLKGNGGVRIELKVAKICTGDQLHPPATTVFHQIDTRFYSTNLQSQGVTSILKYGIAFCGKTASVVGEQQTLI